MCMFGGCPALAGGHTAGCPRSELAHARARPGCGTSVVGDELDAAPNEGEDGSKGSLRRSTPKCVSARTC